MLIRSAFSAEHQGAARLLDGALRRARPHDRAGRAHPGPPRRDARGGRGRDRARDPGPGRCTSSTIRSRGGTHLRTSRSSRAPPLGYAVSRAHHADVGGMEPASLPAFSRELYQEGSSSRRSGSTTEVTRRSSSRTRANPDERRGDLRAQIAAHRLAERRVLRSSSARRGARGRRAPRWTSSTPTRSGSSGPRSPRFRTVAARPSTCWRRSRASSRLARRASRSRGDEIEIDFAGTAPQHPGNLNCPLAVTRSACYFVVRCLTDPTCRRRAARSRRSTVRAPAGCLVNARPPAAVVAGNVETSSRIVDVVFAAFGRRSERAGAGPGHDEQRHLRQRPLHLLRDDRRRAGRVRRTRTGPRGVHVAMSNTLNTPVEALELAYPLRVERYALRARLGRRRARTAAATASSARAPRARATAGCSLLAERRVAAPRRARRAASPARRGATCVNGDELPAKVTV